MIVAIHQPQYMPWSGYFHKMAGADLFVVLDDVQFKKNEWQHRNRIRTSQGWQWLSVPNHYAFPQTIREVRLNKEIPWQEKHWRSLVAAYGKAPRFGRYKGDFEEFYAKTWDGMAEVNIDSIVLLNRLLGINVTMERSSAYHFEGTSTQRLVNICRHFKADMYLSGSGGRDYLEQDLFKNAGIRVAFQEFTPPRYTQHWSRSDGEFVPGLSVIDLLFNCGDESLSILTGTITA
ncbi:MAG: WbqC family protein [Chitinispirillaceae bacterium]|nr:WbqC family protein [Chitinispirillaceae bacterium]